MTRRAIIVATPQYPGGEPLPGTDDDVAAWQDFLLSPEGGAWRSEEISVYVDPRFEVLLAKLIVAADPTLDYALLAFSGHGEYFRTRYGSHETRLAIKPTKFLTETTFTLNAKRELVVMDACRELRVEKEASLMEKLAATDESLTQFSATNRFEASRRLFDEAIESNPTGRAFVYSCEVNQTANDSPSFTRILIAEAVDQVTNGDFRYVLPINDAVRYGSDAMAGFQQPQKPMYVGARRLTHLPFAISV